MPMKFTPLKFQGSLAAAGVALMPYIFLKSTIFSSAPRVFIGDVPALIGTPFEALTSYVSVGVMAIFIVVHLLLTVVFLKELGGWLVKTEGFKALLADPVVNSALFSPLISLPMSVLVLLGPVSFFIPQIATYVELLMWPIFVLFALFWGLLLYLLIQVAKVFLATSIDYTKFHFGWLLDVLAFGAVSLCGATLLMTTGNTCIASMVAPMVLLSIAVGVGIFLLKLGVLFYQQIRSRVMPSLSLLPAYFLVIPPLCLLGFSFYKLLGYAGKNDIFSAEAISALVMVVSYCTAISWFVFLFYILREYLKKSFLSAEYSPAQWGIV